MKNDNKLNFILVEYQECFEHMRHYDNIAQELFKFSFTYYSAIITLSIALYGFLFNEGTINPDSYLYFSLLFFLGFVIGCLLILLLVRNRKYFIDVAHQVNCIREFYMKDIDSFANQLPFKTDYPKVTNAKSSHFFIYYIFHLVNSIFLSISIDSFSLFLKYKHTVLISLSIGILYFIFGIVFTFKSAKK